jgi:hypothetical protein
MDVEDENGNATIAINAAVTVKSKLFFNHGYKSFIVELAGGTPNVTLTLEYGARADNSQMQTADWVPLAATANALTAAGKSHWLITTQQPLCKYCRISIVGGGSNGADTTAKIILCSQGIER